MKKNNTLFLFLLFIALAGSSYYLYKYQNSKANSTSPDRDFAVKDVEGISKIFLGQKNGQNVLLTRQGDHWIVNNKYRVFPNTMHYLLDAIQNLKVNSIPNKAAYESIMKEMASIGIKVEIYDKKNELMKTYYVGGVTEDEIGLYCLMEGANQPYIMFVNKVPANLRTRFDIAEIDWRDRSLFNVVSSEIESVIVDYPYAHNKGFKILCSDNNYRLFDSNNNPIQDPNINSRIIKTYVDAFEGIQAEAITNQHRAKDSINQIKPYISYSLKLKNKLDTVKLKIYPCPLEGEDAINLDKKFLDEKVFFRFYSLRNDGDMLLFQQSQIQGIFYDLQELIKSASKNQ
ncbi:MAG: DUF4340 domain-containing protein [Saprospiraceae bacterium]